MFNLFSGKISSVFTTAFQGLVKTIGVITQGIVDAIDHTLDIVTSLATPILDVVAKIPGLGEPVTQLVNTVTNLVDNTLDIAHLAADNLAKGDLIGAVTNIAAHTLDSATDLVGQALNDASQVVTGLSQLASPLTNGILADVPVLGDVLGSVGQTLDNLAGFVDETGSYVAGIVPGGLVAGLVLDPADTVGGVLQDVSGILTNLVGDIAPITSLVGTVPVVGTVTNGVGFVAQNTIDGIGFIGEHLEQLPPLNPLAWG